MRPIDGDALKEKIEFHPTSVSVCATVEQARGETNFKLRCLKDIDNAPTIAAIPVEWLREKLLDLKKKDAALSRATWLVMHTWEQEQEGR